ncbi:MAG: hypothetical protein JW810_10330 [Sedimentisphaerales bacterium]|nr:hypothetical protein [Sedimentisphaerales bacterium]
MDKLEQQLDSFQPEARRSALEQLWAQVQAGQIEIPPAGTHLNIHCHTFFSFNAYGYSPTHFAWKALRQGLALAGIVDFDVLDGLEELAAAGRLLGLRTTVGLETRVYVPQFAQWEITSPGEPGITYHMGIGFPTARLDGAAREFQQNLKQTAQQRNRELMGRVNPYLSPVELDYERYILSLVPAGNATERHMCLAYARRAQQEFPDADRLGRFWAAKLGDGFRPEDLPDKPGLLNLIRARTMKRGTVGYVQPDSGSFPWMDAFNEFVLQAGGIPCLTWLDGTSEGERHIEELLDIAEASGVAAINIVPDRNYGPKGGDEKYRNLCQIVRIAQRRDLIPVAGTEMNSFGQRFVDDFDSEELRPMQPFFLQGAYIFYGHTVLQRRSRLGYTSDWARSHFPERRERNRYFEQVGRLIPPGREQRLEAFDADSLPGEILDAAAGWQGGSDGE